MEYLLTQINLTLLPLTLLPWGDQEVQAKAGIDCKQLLNKFRSFMVSEDKPTFGQFTAPVTPAEEPRQHWEARLRLSAK